MNLFGAHISRRAAGLLHEQLRPVALYEAANEKLLAAFGIKCFFSSQEEYGAFTTALSVADPIASEPDRAEYGDFQTNSDLTERVVLFLKNKKGLNPAYLIEPTCGKGSFIVAALAVFEDLEKITGVEIYKPYIWETKFRIIDFCISNPSRNKPVIEIHHCNVFDFDFYGLAAECQGDVLVLGNPPWVTNAQLGVLESDNLPPKSNFKRHSGFDAITGKGNFDIGEYITLMMFDAFQHTLGHLAFLVKNAVIKNIIFDQHKRKYKIAEIAKLTIDSKKEFNVSVEASLLVCTLNAGPAYTCGEFDLYHHEHEIREFGWIEDKFVSNSSYYLHNQDIDGVCPFEWRQGIKHDLSSIMEMDRVNGHYVNGKRDAVAVEEDLIYGILKSSDLKQAVISRPRKFTIVTQKKIGQDTAYIQQKFPRTFRYLYAHKEDFNRRKSSIYINKPDFSIFGVGDYSFAPYKVAISGLYKTCRFSLILPFEGKPMMLDDTCYLLGFDSLEFAAYTAILLNSSRTEAFLQSVSFSDAKRMFTKEVLMRIDLFKLSAAYSQDAISAELRNWNEAYALQIQADRWAAYVEAIRPKPVSSQATLF